VRANQEEEIKHKPLEPPTITMPAETAAQKGGTETPQHSYTRINAIHTPHENSRGNKQQYLRGTAFREHDPKYLPG
jgi:hypothetical protein